MNKALRQSSNYACFMKEKKWNIEKIELLNNKITCYIKTIPILGSVIKIQRPSIIPTEPSLDNLAKKNKALFIKIEPGVDIRKKNLKWEKDSWPLLPTKTLHIDLTKSKKDLWNNIDKSTQTSIQQAKKNLKIEHIRYDNTTFKENLQRFHKILKIAGDKKKFPTPSWKDLNSLATCFEKDAHLILATNPETIAGCLLLTYKKTSYYYYAATTEAGRSALAGYAVMWKALKVSKQLECAVLDLEGIYDKRYHKRTKAWKGFTYFKKKFGGSEVTYPRPIIKYYSPAIKLLAKIFN